MKDQGGFSASARRQAGHILSQPPFKSGSARIPDPLRGVFSALGRGVERFVGRPLGHVWHGLYTGLHRVFGSATDLVLTVLAIAIGSGVAWLLVRRRTRIKAKAPVAGLLAAPASETAGDLEARANAAEDEGDFDTAVRLRFRAGLARLEAAGRVRDKSVITTSEVKRTLRQPELDLLADRHEAVAYGGDHAGPADAELARTAWPRVLEAARSSSGDPT